MSSLSRPLTLLALVALLAACSGATSSPAPGGDGTAGPSGGPGSTDDNRIDHPTGATDVVLRFEEGGGFMMPAFLATEAPIFTLYGDGTVIFRDPADAMPPGEDQVVRQPPFKKATLTEEQIQELLEFALGEGGLAIARPTYENPMVADAGTAVFTVNAGGITKTVSIYALGMEGEGIPDMPARASFAKLAERLRNLDNDGAFPTDAYEPASYRAILFDDGGFPGPNPMSWPFDELTPADFTSDRDNPNMQFPSRVMTADELDAIGLSGYEGGLMGITVLGPGDGTSYTFAVRPLLPDETK